MWAYAALAFSCVATAAWMARAAIDAPSFAVVSNLAFVADVVLIPLVTPLADAHPLVYATTLTTSLLAASSFAHHLDRAHAQAHTLDIAMGWVLYTHLALLAAHALVRRWLPRPRRVLFGTTLAEAGALFALFAAYDVVYRNQVYVLAACGAAAHGCTLVHRVCAARGAWRRPAFDFAAVVVLQGVATALQGEVWVDVASPARYDVEHGYWHMLSGTVVGVVVVQTARLLEGNYGTEDGGDRLCRATLVGFALVLLAATALNTDTDRVETRVIVPAQLATLVVSSAVVWRREWEAIDL